MFRNAFVVGVSAILIGCIHGKVATPERPQVFYVACCSPSCDELERAVCKASARGKGGLVRDYRGNVYKAFWDGCEVGKERWREWDK